MNRAIGLYRVSTSNQIDGSGISAQQDVVRQYAEQNGLQLVAEYTDLGVSGAAPLEKREGLLKALAHLEKGDVLLVAKYDRIARDLLLQLTVERTVTQKGAQIISCSAPGSSGTSASDVLLRNLLASVAQYERAIIGQRISQAHQARLARGYVATTPPYGFTVDLNNKLVPEKTEQIVCSAVKRMRECGYSWKKAAEALNQRHYYNRSDRPWSLHNLRAIFVKREGYEKVKRDDKWLSIWEKYIYLPVWWYPARETQVNEAF
jgi:DNA invertase Pin-like site-specific DNA recombinase